MKGRTGVSLCCMLMMAGCATPRPAGKPVLTRVDFANLARRCHVRAVFFGQPRNRLPNVVFTFAEDGVPNAGGVLPPVQCMYDALKTYRYDYFSPMTDAKWVEYQARKAASLRPAA